MGIAASLGVAAAVAFIVAWAMYRFSIGTVQGVPLPLLEIPKGIIEVADHNRYGHPAYFLGDVRARGVWYFFPVMIALKTPVLALVLGGIGFFAMVWHAQRTDDWIPLTPVMMALSVLSIALGAGITIGLRHVLPFYLALSIAVGVAWEWLWRRWTTRARRTALIGGAACAVIGTLAIHPDYLAYFNVLAGRDPSRLVADSDLDWGQDLFRLARAVRARGIDTLTFGYVGTADLSPIVGARVRYWDGSGRPTGWIAVSETWFRRGLISFQRGAYQVQPHAFAWLDSTASFARVGSGIRMYRLPPPSRFPHAPR